MTDKTSRLISALFKTKFDKSVVEVSSISGEPPSQDNDFLFNPLFDQFQGRVRTEDGGRYVFFLAKQGKTWDLDARAI